MALNRQGEQPRCPKCGELIEGKYDDLPGFVGDTFRGWDYEGHVCEGVTELKPKEVAQMLHQQGMTVKEYREGVQADRKRSLATFEKNNIPYLISMVQKMINYGEEVIKFMEEEENTVLNDEEKMLMIYLFDLGLREATASPGVYDQRVSSNAEKFELREKLFNVLKFPSKQTNTIIELLREIYFKQ